MISVCNNIVVIARLYRLSRGNAKQQKNGTQLMRPVFVTVVVGNRLFYLGRFLRQEVTRIYGLVLEP